MTESLLKHRAALEIQAWTVVGTPATDATSALHEAYCTRCSCEKEAFVAALIDQVVADAFASA
jgi:hypothetical protein